MAPLSFSRSPCFSRMSTLPDAPIRKFVLHLVPALYLFPGSYSWRTAKPHFLRLGAHLQPCRLGGKPVKIRYGPAAVSGDESPHDATGARHGMSRSAGKAWVSRKIRESEDRLHGQPRLPSVARRGGDERACLWASPKARIGEAAIRAHLCAFSAPLDRIIQSRSYHGASVAGQHHSRRELRK